MGGMMRDHGRSIFIGALIAVVSFAGWLWTPDLPRSVLEQRYLRDPGDMITLQGTPLHVRADGPAGAPAVILIHGFGSSLQTWDAWADDLSREFRVIRFDLPGAGLSPPDASGDYTDARSIALIAALQDHFGLPSATLVGNSIGGRIAWRFAVQHPDRVSALVLVSPDGFSSQGFDYGEKPDVSPLIEGMRFMLPKVLVRLNLAPAYADPDKLTDATVDRYYDHLLAPGARSALIERMRQTVLVDPVPLLPKIQQPVLLVWGAEDALIPISNAQDYLRLLPDAQLVRLDGIGHVPQEEAPEASLRPVRDFLRTVPD